MADGKDLRSKSMDPAVREMIGKAATMEIKTVWDRYEAMKPQCGFGDTGLCCRHCLQGPCRIDPFGEGPTVGICGSTADKVFDVLTAYGESGSKAYTFPLRTCDLVFPFLYGSFYFCQSAW